MTKYLFILTVFFISNFSNGQNLKEYHSDDENQFDKLQYPAIDKAMGNEGIVLIKFQTDGSKIISIEIINSISETIDEESLRVFNSMNGKWNLTPNEFYLFQFRFKLDFSGRQETETLLKKRDKAYKKKNSPKIIDYCAILKKRNPFDIENLDYLIEAYKNTSQDSKVIQIEKLKSDINIIELIDIK